MAPVLLDHARIKRLVMSMVLALTVVFLSGYVVGFQKAEVRLASSVDTQSLALPTTVVEVPASMEPVIPLKAEPGEMIDVDIADAESAVTNQSRDLPEQVDEKKSELIVPVIEFDKLELRNTVAVVSTQPQAIGGPASTDPEQNEELLIQDTANEETADYTIQVGMYGQLENAEHRVEELIATDLSAYLTDYLNKKNEIRYNVRFGYFDNRKSARTALATFEQEFSGSGYIVHMPLPVKVSAQTDENSDS